AHNNSEQSSRGLGHYVNPNCYQNCAWNLSDAKSVAELWMNSPDHRANMLSPSVSRVGIAFGPGPYWTMNAR
ncbi:MAG: CAP domain-containing protein, partial [Planctomycetaceae bacterium]|nr:CAP domain-containing protein [Planctomycetaceae bacterium]